MWSIKVGFDGEIPMVMHCAKGDVQFRLLNVSYVPGVISNLFSLHAVVQMHEITLISDGVHVVVGYLAFPCTEAGSYVEASRIADAPIAAAVIAPGKMMRFDINDPHVALARSHADTLRRRHAKWALRFLEIYFRVPDVRRRRGLRWVFHGRPGAAPFVPWSVCSWICRGNGLRQPAGRNT